MRKRDLITIGIDAGLRYTGIAYIENNEYKFLQVNNECKEFAKIPLEGAELIFDTCLEIIGNRKGRLAIEDFAFGGNFNAQQGELIGALKYLAYKSDSIDEVTFIAPNTAKKCVTGNGRATKGQVKKAMSDIVGQKIKSSHEADACAMLYTYNKIRPTEAMIRRTLDNRIGV